MTKFDNPNIDGLRREMETLRSNQDEDSDDDNSSSAVANDAKRYQLNTKDSEISRMEEKLEKVKLLEADVASVGHLAESRDDLKELQKEEEAAENVTSGGYDTGIFAQVCHITWSNEEAAENVTSGGYDTGIFAQVCHIAWSNEEAVENVTSGGYDTGMFAQVCHITWSNEEAVENVTSGGYDTGMFAQVCHITWSNEDLCT